MLDDVSTNQVNSIMWQAYQLERELNMYAASDLPEWVMADSGVGLDSQTVDNLFTRFFQADSSLRRRIGGTGLGLEISRNLARMMGGDIHASGQPGVGSVFTVTLNLP